MRRCAFLVLLAAVGCKSPQDMILEAATGGQVDIKEGKITVKGEDGKTVVVQGNEAQGSLTITDEKGETATISGKDGSLRVVSDKGVTEIGGAKIPEGFPLPLIDGAKVVTSSSSTTGKAPVYHLVAEVDGAPKAVADFYAQALADKGLAKVQRTEHQMGAGAMVTLTAKQKGLEVAVTVIKQEDKGKTMLTIAWDAD